jgi:hypothetical protein
MHGGNEHGLHIPDERHRTEVTPFADAIQGLCSQSSAGDFYVAPNDKDILRASLLESKIDLSTCGNVLLEKEETNGRKLPCPAFNVIGALGSLDAEYLGKPQILVLSQKFFSVEFADTVEEKDRKG